MKVLLMNDIVTALDKIPSGRSCCICEIDNSLSIKNRLNELGFFKGAKIDKLQVGSFGSPIACRVCGAVIAIRAEDAEKITVKM